jgi:hypothetical protein
MGADLGPLPVPNASEGDLRARYPDAGAIVLEDEGKMEIAGSGDLGMSLFDHHRVIRILNARGHRYAYVVIPYGENSTVEEISARTIGPSGTVTPLDPSTIFDVSLYPSFVFFSDQRAKIFTLPAVEDGALIEYRYRLIVHNRTLWHGWQFQTDAPVLHSRFTMVCPSEWTVASRQYGITVEPSKAKVPAGFKSTQVWEARDVAPLADEFAMPPRGERVARLAIAPLGFTTWGDVASWYRTLAGPRMSAGSELRAVAARLTTGADSDREKLRRIFEWVRDRVRYVAVEIGIGGYQPHPADQVLLNQYGDCKDMSTLLCALGREAGLTVLPVLVSTWQNGPPDTTLPSPLHFNHAIAYCPTVGEGGTWLDATEKACPFGELPWYDQGIPVLVVGEGAESGIRVTTCAGADRNTLHLQWTAMVRTDGSARVLGETIACGSVAAQLRDELQPEDPAGRRRWTETMLASRCAGVELDSLAIVGLEPPGDTLRIGYAFRTTAFAQPRGGNELTLRPGGLVSSDLPDYFRSSTRTTPVRFRFPLRTTLDLTLHVPGFWELQGPPLRDSLSSPYGTQTRTWSGDGPRVQMRSVLELPGRDVPPQEYRKFREFLDAMRLRDLQEMRIVRP